MDASEIYSKRLNAKEVIFPKQGEFIFPIADGRIKLPGGDQDLRTSSLRKSSTLKTQENCVGSISSTPRIRNSRKPSRTRVRSWKHQLLLLCPVKLRKIVGVVHPTKFRQNLRVFWKLINPQECVWEIRYRIIMKTILQEKVKIHYSTTIWFTSLLLCLKL